MTDVLNSHRLGIVTPRISWGLAIALVAILFVLRLPLIQHPTPVHPDEVNFTAALGFPTPYPVHHPGYPLWVAMGTLAQSFGVSDYGAYQIWSLASSVLLPLILFVGLQRVFSTSLAWWLAFATGVNPLVWFHSVTAMTYIPAATVGLTVAGLCYRAVLTRSFRASCLAAIVLVIGLFVRADLLIFLGPLLAYAAWRSRPGGWFAIAILALGIGGYMALISSLYETSSGRQPLQTLSHTIDVVFGTSVFRLGLIDGLARNVVKIATNIVWDMGIAVVLIIPAIVNLIRSRRSDPQRFWFLVLWASPCLAFLLLMHVVQGYFVLLILAGYVSIGLYLQKRFSPTIATRTAALLALCSLTQFTLYSWSPQSTGFKQLLDAKIAFLSASGLRQINLRDNIHKPGDFWPTAAHDEPQPEPTSPPH